MLYGFGDGRNCDYWQRDLPRNHAQITRPKNRESTLNILVSFSDAKSLGRTRFRAVAPPLFLSFLTPSHFLVISRNFSYFSLLCIQFLSSMFSNKLCLFLPPGLSPCFHDFFSPNLAVSLFLRFRPSILGKNRRRLFLFHS